MERRKPSKQCVMMAGCLAVLFIFAFAIFVRAGTRIIIVEKLGINNALTDLIFFDYHLLNEVDKEDTSIDIAWEELYPFEGEQEESANSRAVTNKEEKSAIDRVVEKIRSLERDIELFTTIKLPGYLSIVGGAKMYNSLVGWNYASFSEYNGVVELPDGYLTDYHAKSDAIDEYSRSLVDLKHYCDELGIDFLTVMAPKKISKYEDVDIANVLDFANQNADELLGAIEADGVKTYDMREEIRNEGLKHHELFFRTDHHWRPTTALWAAQKTLQHCNEEFDLRADAEILNQSLFNAVVYPDCFLGAQGKKATLTRTTPDDMVLLYPGFTTMLHYTIPSIGLDKTGDFSVTYDMSKLKHKDFYTTNQYTVYNYGDVPLVSIENLQTENDKKILLIRESFSDCLISFLALGVGRLDAIDLRYFDGSVRSYIASTDPDIVIILYNANYIGFGIDYSNHLDPFDFR